MTMIPKELNGDSFAIRSKAKLKEKVKVDVTKLFHDILDLVEVSVDGPNRFKSVRSKILRLSNDSIRNIHKELDLYYNVAYVATTEEVIELSGKPVPPRSNSIKI